MTTETDEKGTNHSEREDADSTGDSPSCGPGCGCGEPAGKANKKRNIAICLVVLIAIGGILLFKTTNAKQTTSGPVTTGYSITNFAAKVEGPVLNSAGQKGGSGASLSALSELDTVAAKLNTVFLVIPSKDNAPSTNETGSALASVERTLNEKGLSTGIYTLQADSPDYPDVAAKVTAPGIAVLTKGRGIGYVSSGGISETNLMQAYVASTIGGGCCPPGGGNAAIPCN